MKPSIPLSNLSKIGGLNKLTKAELENLHPKIVRFLVQTMCHYVENVISANRPLSERTPSDTRKVDIKSLKSGASLTGYILNCLRSNNFAVQNILEGFNKMSDIREDRRPNLTDLLRAYEKTLPEGAPPLVRKTGSITHINLSEVKLPQGGIADIALRPNLDFIIGGLQTTPEGNIRFDKGRYYMLGKEDEKTRTCPLYGHQDGKKIGNRCILEGGEIARVPVQIMDSSVDFQIGEYDAEHGTTMLYGHQSYNGVFGEVQLTEKDGIVSPRTLQEGNQVFMLGKKERNTTELVFAESVERYDDWTMPGRRIQLGTSVERKRLGSFQLNEEGEMVSIKKTPEGLWLGREGQTTTELYNPKSKDYCHRQLEGMALKTVTQKIPVGLGGNTTKVYEMGEGNLSLTALFPKGSAKGMGVGLVEKDGALSIKSVEGRPGMYIGEVGVDKKQGTHHIFDSNAEEYGWRRLRPDNSLVMSDGFEFGGVSEKTGLVEIFKPDISQVFDHVQVDTSPDGGMVIRKTSDGKYLLGAKDGECTELIHPHAKHFYHKYGKRILDENNTIQTVEDNDGKIYEVGLYHNSRTCYIYEPESGKSVTDTVQIIKKEDGSFDFIKAQNGIYYLRSSDWGEKVLLKSFGPDGQEDIYGIRLLNGDGTIHTISDNEGRVYEMVREEDFMRPGDAGYKKTAIVWYDGKYYKGNFNEDETMIQDLEDTDAPEIDDFENDIPF